MSLKLLALFPLSIIFFQIYHYAVTRKGEERQSVCRSFGIVALSVGVVALVFRDTVFVVAGMVSMMAGFRLVAHGLDRLDKQVYIDRYDNSAD